MDTSSALKNAKLLGVYDLLHMCLDLEAHLQKIESIFASVSEMSELVIKYQPTTVDLMAKVRSFDEKISQLIENIKVESDTSEPSPLVTATLYADYAMALSGLSTEVEQLIDNVIEYL